MTETPADDPDLIVSRLAAAMAQVFPADVATAVRRVADERERARREEQPALPGVARPRQRQFLAGRECAHAALEAIGRDGSSIARGPAGEPLWPTGTVGSIAHTGEVAAAAVARSTDAWAIGLDLEALDPPLDATVTRLVRAGDGSADWPAPPQLRPYVSKFAFCAKECVYKALFPATGWSLQFEDVAVAIGAGHGRFRARISPRFHLAGQHLGVVDGRMTVAAGHVVAAVWIPQAAGR